MYKIFFYQDSRGNEPVYDYLKLLSKRKDKDSRIKLNKCNDYIQALAEYGTSIGEPYLNILKMKFGNCVLCEIEFYLRPGKVMDLYYYITL